MNFSDTLINWYNEHRRDLPWRNTRDPYRIWISEIILQQTRVAQGLEYYRRFIERFPDVAALANAPEDEVLRLWQGLGYYSRARNLHAAAKSMNGTFPVDYAGVRALKGVGDYTAAAICSIAYGMPYAVVDGNVYRVLSRYFAIHTPIDSTQGKKEFASLANELLDHRRPDLYNQAIMDFGAMVCTPASPDCNGCPLADSCAALASNTVAELPVKEKKTKTTDRYLTYLKIVADGHTFIRKRDDNDIWKGLYEYPLIETSQPIADIGELTSHPAFATLTAGKETTVRQLCQNVKHVLSHRILYASLYEVRLHTDHIEGYMRIPLNDLNRYAFPTLHRKLENLMCKTGTKNEQFYTYRKEINQ